MQHDLFSSSNRFQLSAGIDVPDAHRHVTATGQPPAIWTPGQAPDNMRRVATINRITARNRAWVYKFWFKATPDFGKRGGNKLRRAIVAESLLIASHRLARFFDLRHHFLDLATRCDVPDPDREVETAARQHAAVRTEGNDVHPFIVTERLQQPPRSHIPQPDFVIPAAAGENFAVRTERYGIDSVGVPPKRLEFLAAGHVPDFYRVIVTAAGEILSVTAQGN